MSSDAFTRLEIPRLSGPSLTQERDRARARGHAAGYAAGYAEGMRLAAARAEREADERAERDLRAAAAERARVDAVVAALESASAAFDARTTELTAPAVADLYARAVELAEAIVGRELSDPVRSALATATRVDRAVSGLRDSGASAPGEESGFPVARLSPADAETLAATGSGPRSVAVEVDPDLSPGDATIRLADGAIDLRISAAFARARRCLEDGA